MASTKHNIKFNRGADENVILSWRTGTLENYKTKPFWDFTGCTAELHIFNEDTLAIVDTLSTANGRLVLVNKTNPDLSVVLGGIKIISSEEVSDTHSFDTAYYDLHFIDSLGDKHQLISPNSRWTYLGHAH